MGILLGGAMMKVGWRPEWQCLGAGLRRQMCPKALSRSLRIREHWSILNRLRTGSVATKYPRRSGVLQTFQNVSVARQHNTADHTINRCPLHRPPSTASLFAVRPLTRTCLHHTVFTIYKIQDTRYKIQETLFNVGLHIQNH